MSLIALKNVSIGFRGPDLLDDVTCQIEAGARIGLLGRNGAGKSTLLKLLNGDLEPDHGTVVRASEIEVSYLQQDVPVGDDRPTAEIVAAGFRQELSEGSEPWRHDHLVKQTLLQMQLDGRQPFSQLSSGMKRRALLASAVVNRPDLLLLDEPTNHLDVGAIEFLEGFLQKWPGAMVVVTHDRAFLQKVATQILEIDRGRLFNWSCSYDEFIRRKNAALLAEEKQQALFDKKLAQEEAWIRQGIKARRTRNEGRVRALEVMRDQRQRRRSEPGVARLQIDAGVRSGNLVAEAENISFGFGDRTLIRDFSTSILRGDKIGLLGPNGAGKTTLLRVLLGEIQPHSGSMRVGTNLQIAYFDQLRDQLDMDETVEQNIGQGQTQLTIGGKQKHVLGYLQDFLFTPDRARTKVKFLSGGERNRVLLARMFSKPANVIVLDEPTNDLDVETLELLEARLVEFAGTVLVVSHDRAFLNNVVTSTIVFEPDGIREYVGGYDDWLVQRKPPASDVGAPAASKAPRREKPAPAEAQKRKLSYHEQRELDGLPAKIETLESEIAAMHQAMAGENYYQRPGGQLAADQQRLKATESELASAYDRWAELEADA